MIEIGPAHDGRVELRFKLPVDHPGQPIGVAGSFNEWDWERAPFRCIGGGLVASVVVRTPGRYEFRYRTKTGGWFNDDHADDYVPNEFGGSNCLIEVSCERGDERPTTGSARDGTTSAAETWRADDDDA